MSGQEYLSNHLVKDQKQIKNLVDKDELDSLKKITKVTTKQKETCTSCKKDITDQIIKIDSRNFHVKCFTCHNCKKQLEQIYHISGPNFLCGFCFKNDPSNQKKVCGGCKKNFDGKGVLFEGQTYHKECFNCSKCSKPFTEKQILVQDGKPVCPKCKTSTPTKNQPVKQETKKYSDGFDVGLDDLESFAKMKDMGIITKEEFEEKKKEILSKIK